MSQLRIKELLETRLAGWADAQGIKVAYENVTFDPPDDIYLESYVMPAASEAIDLSRQLQILRGVYQVNISIPAGRGMSAGGQIAEQLIALFPEGQEMSDELLTCYINSTPSVFPGTTTNTMTTLYVSMSYRADIA